MSRTNAMTTSRTRRICAAILCAAAALLAGAGTAARAEAQVVPVPTDWTSLSATGAGGTLLGSTVTLRDSPFDPRIGSRVDDSSTLFSSAVFTPALAKSDYLYVSGPPAGTSRTYTIDVTARMKDPIFNVASLGSRITFPGKTVVKVSGEADLSGGASVTGIPSNTREASGIEDANGTVKVLGTYDSANPITFTVVQTPGYQISGTDGIYVQLLAQPGCTDWTSVSSSTASGRLFGAGTRLSSPAFDLRTGSRVDGSSTMFSRPPFSPLLPTSDLMYLSGPYAGGTYSYTIALSAPVAFPIIQLASLGSKITFPGAVVTRVSGPDARFVAGGASVTGTPSNEQGAGGIEDANGTVRLAGTFDASHPIRLDVVQTPGYPLPGRDGIYLQLCSTG